MTLSNHQHRRTVGLAVLATALFVVCIVGIAKGGTTVTETPGPSQMHAADGTSVTFKAKDGLPTPHAQCVNAVAALFKGPDKLTATCWDSFSLVVEADCANVKAPTIPLVKQADGSWLEPDARAEPPVPPSTDWPTTQFLYVHNPAWPAGAPACWVRGWTADEWRVNGTDPSAPVMERKEAGMADLPDGPLDTTPAPESQEFLDSWALPESCALRHHEHICYPPGSFGETCGACPSG